MKVFSINFSKLFFLCKMVFILGKMNLSLVVSSIKS